ncbi:hypothetical protein DUNSADRAFT_17147 [Dunaliella salina]|uniref:histone acetyltransferase n=1 Tax=Dunaliella salina TaxID=3046 RepID=A0ABQ7H0B7_DUNSA|nr:hypothetical protein DUNSADRAFT_17147 [Dunaliella salina]|eukprot:KAF5840303.1 hypothetical protein DUNSADRAFT_17147 [Dunaliella salina]
MERRLNQESTSVSQTKFLLDFLPEVRCKPRVQILRLVPLEKARGIASMLMTQVMNTARTMSALRVLFEPHVFGKAARWSPVFGKAALWSRVFGKAARWSPVFGKAALWSRVFGKAARWSHVFGKACWSPVFGKAERWSSVFGKAARWSRVFGKAARWSHVFSKAARWSPALGKAACWSSMFGKAARWSPLFGKAARWTHVFGKACWSSVFGKAARWSFKFGKAARWSPVFGEAARWRQAKSAPKKKEKHLDDTLNLGLPMSKGVFLHVLEGNTGALRFYERLGFQQVGRVPNFYTTTVPHSENPEAASGGSAAVQQKDALLLHQAIGEPSTSGVVTKSTPLSASHSCSGLLNAPL